MSAFFPNQRSFLKKTFPISLVLVALFYGCSNASFTTRAKGRAANAEGTPSASPDTNNQISDDGERPTPAEPSETNTPEPATPTDTVESPSVISVDNPTIQPSPTDDVENPTVSPTVTSDPSATPSPSTITPIPSVSPTPAPTPVASPSPKPTPIVVNTDADVPLTCAARANQMKTLTQKIVFEDPNKACPWNTADNGAKVDGKLTARIEQEIATTLPTGALICKFGLDFPNQQIRYDDHIFLTMNEYVLMASTLPPDHYTADGNLRIYDWAKFKNLAFGSADPYCLGQSDGGTCVIPDTEVTGKMQLVIPDTELASLSRRLFAKGAVKFRFITTGDNDASTDCRHAKVEANASFSYITP